MTYTLEQYETLKAAYASGTLSVRYGDQSVTYHSRAEMRIILDEMEGELGVNRRCSVLDRASMGVYRKGL